ncbi:flagellar hook assembly protein FlgD [Azospirillum sp. YIM DDC1]|uniref:Basal-body rod modification protein FlgD n=1 Tax=Azospirillum aestuarii TaxID=2802052 RepID=A0ABS1I384_9PROT|nr:flagellar hook assembly protein FlgD [Azospirillum aestuarii]MBK3775948.1 flagellar hook assembly protein FlgD [Azospirillum brasilense]MBK4721187.1 flagellar hook assembly protein FlgD [Azospirillum aestuarii]TWA88841.1 flagellar basal-body rod modification protein FlgD [Azospirillum brasilense]
MTTTAATNTATTPPSAAAKKQTVDYEAFLKLLTAQLRNQDPLSPMDATQFMTQLAQLSTVEQGVRTNETLGQVLDTLKNSGMRLDMAYLGRKVEAASDRISLSEGKAEMAYAIDGAAASVKIEVVNDAGQVIYSAPGSPKTGRQTFTWDGKRSDGTAAADGTYLVRVTAKDKAGASLTTATVTTDTVAEVRSVNGETQFVLKGGATVKGTDILSAS